jgi:hypothetical protein
LEQQVSREADLLLTDLRRLIRELGTNGGLIGPSVYDTAQVIRFAPPEEVGPALNWLLVQQHSDGGWGDPAVPRARDVPTLAALLALRKNENAATRDATQAGLAFLRRQAPQWIGPIPEDIPLAAELILPTLVDEARQQGMDLPSGAYKDLRALGEKRRRLVAHLEAQPGTPLVHSWEAWGRNRDAALLDAAGSIGHNPAATAAWLYATRDCAELVEAHEAARHYLDQSSCATGVDIPGVVPAVWPYARNEQIVSLFAIFLAGLMNHPALHDATRSQVDDLWRSLRPDGQGICDHFASDGDNTAMLYAVVATAGYQPDLSVLQRYIVGDSCLTYPNEMQRSLSATAHAAHAMALLGGESLRMLNYLDERRAPDGRWLGDKWHASWLYLSTHTIHALIAAGRFEQALSILPTLLDHQHSDGSWGITAATGEETAYAMLGLLALDRAGVLPHSGRQAIRRGGRWLLANYRPLTEEQGACWIAKALYRPRRIARAIELSAALAYVLDAQYGGAGLVYGRAHMN